MDLISGPLAESLKRGRDGFNARFAAARKAGKLEADAFLDHLTVVVDPIVRAVAAEFSEKVDTVTMELYDLSLALMSAGALGPGAKSHAVGAAWKSLLPRVPKLLAREPGRVAGCVTNAVYNLDSSGDARSDAWLAAMLDLASGCSNVQSFLDCGKVVGWRCGLAQYRAGALATAKQLDPSLAAKALGIPDAAPTKLAAAIDRLIADPWLTPDDAVAPKPDPRRLRLVRQAGEFRGFGGAFIRPPTVATVDGELLVSDGEATWGLIADVFGVHIHRVDRPGPPARTKADGVKVDANGMIQWGDAAARFDDLAVCSSVACDATTLAITVPTSHRVFLLARG